MEREKRERLNSNSGDFCWLPFRMHVRRCKLIYASVCVCAVCMLGAYVSCYVEFTFYIENSTHTSALSTAYGKACGNTHKRIFVLTRERHAFSPLNNDIFSNKMPVRRESNHTRKYTR